MREVRHLSADIDQWLEEAARAQQQLDAERWRAELRPRTMRPFADRAKTLTWSRALLKLAPTPCGAGGLDSTSVEPRSGAYVMVGEFLVLGSGKEVHDV